MLDLLIKLLRKAIMYVFTGIYWLDDKLPDIEQVTMEAGEIDEEEEEDEDAAPTDPSVISVNLQPVYFGQLVVGCPACSRVTEEVGMGLATIEQPYPEDDNSPEKEMGLPNMLQVGIVQFPCGHTLHGTALTNKIGNILNAKEHGLLTPMMISKLTDFDETE